MSFEISHHVWSTTRRWDDVVRRDDLADAYAAAELAAALTTMSPWCQELIDTETGNRWSRTVDTPWVPESGSPLS